MKNKLTKIKRQFCIGLWIIMVFSVIILIAQIHRLIKSSTSIIDEPMFIIFNDTELIRPNNAGNPMN